MESSIETCRTKGLIRESVGTEVAMAKPAWSKGMAAPIKMPEMRAIEVVEAMVERTKPERLEGTKIESK